jgi:hypothetical protein
MHFKKTSKKAEYFFTSLRYYSLALNNNHFLSDRSIKICNDKSIKQDFFSFS